MSNVNKDELLREAVRASKYHKYVGIAVSLNDNIDLSYQEQVSLILARELKKFRPELFAEENRDLVYVVNNGGSDNYSLPSSDLTVLMENEKPYDDSYIGVYSLEKRKMISKLYKGDGTRWVAIQHKGE